MELVTGADNNDVLEAGIKRAVRRPDFGFCQQPIHPLITGSTAPGAGEPNRYRVTVTASADGDR